jgi:hypothetical protein
VLPDSSIETLHEQIDHARSTHEKDLSEGFGEVYLPCALKRKYVMNKLGLAMKNPVDKIAIE